MHTIRTVLEYVTDSPPVPVVVCEGSGRAADLIAFACKFAPCDERAVKDDLLAAIQKMFDIETSVAETVLDELLLCVERKNLITIFSSSGSTAVSEETGR
jgi:transient receptor potential cation channel subfamily M member 3